MEGCRLNHSLDQLLLANDMISELRCDHIRYDIG